MTKPSIRRAAALFITLAFAISSLAQEQQPAVAPPPAPAQPPAKNAPEPPKPAASEQPTDTPLKGGARLGSQPQPQPNSAPTQTKARLRPLGDYVPCLFDEKEAYDLRAVAKKPLSQEDATKAISAAKAKVINGAAPDKVGETKNNLGKLNADTLMNTVASASDVSAEIQKELTDVGVDPTTAKSAGDAAQTAVTGGTYDRPPDVSCSFSLMQWQETRDTFGRRVANQYVAIEVNVRNLNPQNEFLIHDVQVAVDTGLDRKQFGRFQAGRDKQIVRAVIQRGQTEDFRNLAINSLLMMGAIAGGASAAVTQGLASTAQANDFSTAVAIFQGPLTTGLQNIFPDHTIEHINHVNDLGFSPSSANKTIVPTQGSVPLVTFLPQRPLEQLPFAYCGNNKPKQKSADSSSKVNDSICSVDNDPPTPPINSSISEYYGTRPLRLSKWKPLALAVLERHVFVIVAGVHIKELAKGPTFTSISCPPGNDTTIALGKITSATATCTIKGTDLDLAASEVELQNATDSTDKTQVQGALSVGTDTTQGTVQFNVKDLTGLKGTKYTLYYSPKSGGSAQTTSLSVTVQQAVSLDLTSLSFDVDKDTKAPQNSKSVTLTNNNGASDISISEVSKIAGTAAEDFSIDPKSTCMPTPKSVSKAGGTCAIAVTFNPTKNAANNRTASFSITIAGAASPLVVQIKETQAQQAAE